jgi:hypothetical protein
MSIGRFSREIFRCFVAALIASLIVLASPAPGRASADERGMIGITFRQLFAETQPNHRGPLVVLRVIEDSPAAKAGIHCSDFVVAIDGTPVPGRDFSEILKKDLQGPVGGTVRLTVLRYDGSQSEITLVRAPYPTHVSQTTDPFVYRVPGSWGTDPRYVFPLPWWPKIPYRGFEDIFFSPNFDETDSPEYHSFVFFLWIEGTHRMTAVQLQSDAVAYFRGIAEERGRNYDFTPDVSKVSATYKQDSATSTLGSAPARAFSGTLTIYDTHGKVITLNSEVRISTCGTPDHTVLFFAQSLEPRDGEIWKQLDAIRDTYRCTR